MRKIESEMIKAIREKRDWKSGNTEVVQVRARNGINYADIYLHGNHIATAHPDSWDSRPWAYANTGTFKEWPTRTTRSRLRALGVNASIKNYCAVLDGMPL